MRQYPKSEVGLFMEAATRMAKFDVCVLFICAVMCNPILAEDWPTYRHDNRRSGVTGEALRAPLRKAWVYSSSGRPQTAWPGPAKWDAYAGLKGLKSMRNFDPVFHATVAGDSVYFGSSVDDAAHCLDIATGKERWVFFTDGPVRLPPTYDGGRVYFGSDDGYAYCLDARNGALVWKYRAAEDDHFVPSNSKLISLWPCRTGVLLADDKAYFAGSLVPWNASYLCAVDARTGSDNGDGSYRSVQRGLTIQGAMLASSRRLYISQGRQAPIICDRKQGRLLGSIGKSGDGGVFALLADDNTLVHGHGQNHRAGGELRSFDAETKDYIATFPAATSIVVTNTMAYLLTADGLSAFNRVRYLSLNRQKNALLARQGQIGKQLKALGEKAKGAEGKVLSEELDKIRGNLKTLESQMPSCFTWTVECSYPHGLILAGDLLFAGGDDGVAAFGAKNGELLWDVQVKGKAHGLVAANGCLLVSTDAGNIYCFTAK